MLICSWQLLEEEKYSIEILSGNMERNIILVAVDASIEGRDCALTWAASNVARASDSLILLALLPSLSHLNPDFRPHQSATSQFLFCMSKKLRVNQRKEGCSYGVDQDTCYRVKKVYSNMMQELRSVHDLTQVKAEVRVVALQSGSVASKAKELQANWVILDRQLWRESEYCLKQLKCNIVLVDHNTHKILKEVNNPSDENLKRQGNQNDETETGILGLRPKNIHRDYVSAASPIFDTCVSFSLNSCFFNEKVKAKARSSESHFQSKLRFSYKPSKFITGKSHTNFLANTFVRVARTRYILCSLSSARKELELKSEEQCHVNPHSSKSKADSLTVLKRSDKAVEVSSPTMNRTSSIRKAMSLQAKQRPNPPPMCSVCKHDAPIFGMAPRKLGFKEIERATNGFSQKNFLGEGGFGPVHKGVLPDGQVVAVKQHKRASEFWSEVGVLSCARHRNVVILIGYCTETEWLLVYEFSCNGSLDNHLYGKEKKESMPWRRRMRVAIGAARGLRYLHEDCRIGCIVHTNFRPRNIFLTHDFEAMVGDFGLARWQVNGQSAEKRVVIDALGNAAPEYSLSGLISEKMDVYAFGVVLLELLSGLNVTDFLRKFVSEQGSLLLEGMNVKEIIDPLLENNYVEKQVECMMVTAKLCISPNPDQRPRMSKVLKILEKDVFTKMACGSRKISSICSSQNTSLSLIKLSACGENIERKSDEPVSNGTPSGANASRVPLAKFFQNSNYRESI